MAQVDRNICKEIPDIIFKVSGKCVLDSLIENWDYAYTWVSALFEKEKLLANSE